MPVTETVSYDDLRFFRAKLEGGYDWTYAPRYLWKKLAMRMWLPGARNWGLRAGRAELGSRS
jgi:hypothetical protein